MIELIYNRANRGIPVLVLSQHKFVSFICKCCVLLTNVFVSGNTNNL